MDFKALVAAPLVAFLIVASANEVTMPSNWSASVSARSRNAFQIGVDPQVTFEGKRSLTVKALNPVADVEYASAMQYVHTFGYEGKRVRFSGSLKTIGVTQWAGVWLAPHEVRGFNGMTSIVDGRPVGLSLPAGDGVRSGATDWHPVNVVIDVPTGPGKLSMGLSLVGGGQAWLSDLKFEEVDANTPLTATTVGLDLQKVVDELLKANSPPMSEKRTPVKQIPQNLALDT